MKTLKNFFLPLVIALVVLELGARLVYTVNENLAANDHGWFILSSSVGWALRPGFQGTMGCGTRAEFDARGFQSVDTPQVQDDTKNKVIFLGDSNTFGYCVEADQTFVEAVDRLIPNASAINLGVIGYTSFQGYKALLERGEALDPDVIVVSFNFNDRRYVLEESLIDSDSAFKSTTGSANRKQLLDDLRLSFLVRALLRVIKAMGISEQPVKSKVDLRNLQPRVSIENYRRNLTRIVEWARNHNSRVLFVLMGDNPVTTAYLRKGIVSLENGQFEDAIGQLRVAMRDPWFGDLARLYLADVYTRIEMPEKADDLSIISPKRSRNGGTPVFMDTIYNDAMREVGAKYQVEIIDARALLNRAPGDFTDMCHFDTEGHKKIAHLLHEYIDRMLELSEQ